MAHKWAKEIIAWANGAEIECICISDDYDNPTHWKQVIKFPEWDDENMEFRIKPQPKEPQYLYVLLAKHNGKFELSQVPIECHPEKAFRYIGKIKLEQDD